MGFSKKRVPKTIPIALRFEVEDRNTKTGEVTFTAEDVVHVFERPTPASREALADALTNPRGRGRSPKRVLQAAWDFWNRHIMECQGYDDLEEFSKEHPGSEGWKLYFKDEIGMEHVQAAVFALLASVGGEEGELLKKSESSLEKSSESEPDSTKTPMSATG